MVDFVSSGGVSLIRLCDDSDGEFLYAFLGRIDPAMSTRNPKRWDCVEKVSISNVFLLIKHILSFYMRFAID